MKLNILLVALALLSCSTNESWNGDDKIPHSHGSASQVDSIDLAKSAKLEKIFIRDVLTSKDQGLKVYALGDDLLVEDQSGRKGIYLNIFENFKPNHPGTDPSLLLTSQNGIWKKSSSIEMSNGAIVFTINMESNIPVTFVVRMVEGSWKFLCGDENKFCQFSALTSYSLVIDVERNRLLTQSHRVDEDFENSIYYIGAHVYEYNTSYGRYLGELKYQVNDWSYKSDDSYEDWYRYYETLADGTLPDDVVNPR